MKQQQPYFIKQSIPLLPTRNASQKQSFIINQSEERKSLSQNKLISIRKQTPVQPQLVHTPVISNKLKKNSSVQQNEFLLNEHNQSLSRGMPRLEKIRVAHQVDLPHLVSPQTHKQSVTPEQQIINFKSLETLQKRKETSPRRFKSDPHDVSYLINNNGQNANKQASWHIPKQNIQANSIKMRVGSNYTPLKKLKTEPNDIVGSPLIHQPTTKHLNESRDILYQLQKNQGFGKIVRTEPEDPYNLLNGKHPGIRIKKQTESLLYAEKYRDEGPNFVDIPNEDFSLFFDENQSDKLKGTQITKTKTSTNQLISQQTKDRILDLLFLTTGELKKKFNDEQKIQQSKLTNRTILNRVKLPISGKGKFPQDFFNVLLNNDSQY